MYNLYRDLIIEEQGGEEPGMTPWLSSQRILPLAASIEVKKASYEQKIFFIIDEC